MKIIKWFMAAAVVASLSGCIIPPPDSRNNDYDNSGNSGHHHKHGHKQYDNDGNRQAADYESSDGVRMITRDGVTLPDCEAVGGSQADNGSTCFYR
ncbi:hypothetical protein RHD99_03840 [Buttiauxella selenatireducens]|uniref:Lipoprotein n=1 Tax=Buttiauxella selenatireducens TaxID=3073902 RepID=A0ABY9SC87_9ENTR|nr:hypothetical protein [Buttiauxella sp. R73]WMY75121.1 hypothetical protein RHD99_03840 [Buttiauxella sp. R73]